MSSRPERPIAADWLALRRDADTRAREAARHLLIHLERHLSRRPEPVTVIDVGAGTGANQAYLAPRLPLATRWVRLDHDESLLGVAEGAATHIVGGIEALDVLVGDAAASGQVLVTCSALLDLLSVAELDELVDVLARHRAPGLFSLTVDGSVTLDPVHPDDQRLGAAFDAHQARDGRPGPAAAAHVAARARALGLDVHRAATAWQLSPMDGPLIDRLLAERVEAAIEQQPDLAPAAGDWLDTRRQQFRTRALSVSIGHVDLLLLPTLPT